MKRETGTLLRFTNSMMDALTCPVCLKPLSPPVYQYQNGHTACASCCISQRAKGICPSCFLSIGGNRCMVVGKIIESLEINCKYAALSCKKLLQYTKLSKRAEHEDVCEFRLFHCPAAGCNDEGPNSGLPPHFQNRHSSPLVELQSQNASFISETGDSDYDVCHSQYVLVQAPDSEDGSLLLIHHQFDQKFGRFSFSCTSFGASTMWTRFRLSVETDRHGNLKVSHLIEGSILNKQDDRGFTYEARTTRRLSSCSEAVLFSHRWSIFDSG